MEEEGVTFKCNTNVGVDITANDLLREFNVIVLAGGSTIPRDLMIPGRELKGIHFAMDYLKQQNKRISGTVSEEPGILATGKSVVVIGGGDTGSDCVGTANRQKAGNVIQFELLPKPPSERNQYMPWPLYPMILKTTTSHEEGCERHWAVSTKEFIGDKNGNLRALKIVDLEWKISEKGQPAQFIEIPGTEREVPCELVLLAMGFTHPQHEGLLHQLELELDTRGNVRADEKDFKTSMPRIFVAGDMRRGQSLVVWAISEGRECARKVDESLNNGVSILATKD